MGDTSSKNKRLTRSLRQRKAFSDPESGALQRRASAQCTMKLGPDGSHTMSPSMYPAAVSCGKLVEVVTISTKVFTASTTKTITAPQGTITSVGDVQCEYLNFAD